MSTEQKKKSPVGEDGTATSVTSDVTTKNILSAEMNQLNDSHHISESEHESNHPLRMINSTTHADDGERKPEPKNSSTESLCSSWLNEEIKESLTKSLGGGNRLEVARGASPVGERRAESKINRPDGTETVSLMSDVTTKCTLLGLSEQVTETLTESTGGGVQLEVDRHVRSRRTFVPGPDQLNGLVDVTFDSIHVLEDDDRETTHPLEIVNSVTHELVDV